MNNRTTLADSRWAASSSSTSPHAPTTQTTGIPPPIPPPIRLSRLLPRIRWKAESLLNSWSRARPARWPLPPSFHVPVALHEYEDTLRSIRGGKGADGKGTREEQRMFMLDFFEFYSLLERGVVACLSGAGVKVPRGDVRAEKSNGTAVITGEENAINGASHRYHANVLDALDKEDCVLHAALGMGDVRRYLGLAKMLRNKWKNADEADGEVQEQVVKIEELELPEMLRVLVKGLVEAKEVVDERWKDGAEGKEQGEEMDLDDGPLEVVEDGMEMEWEL